MVPLSSLSRRALVAAAAVASLAPGAEARKRKRRRTPPPPPLAFLALVLTDVTAPDAFGLLWHLRESLAHPASGFTRETAASVGVASDATAAQVRARIVAARRNSAALALANAGRAVPEDRIAVTLF
jgi:hypothetical protein